MFFTNISILFCVLLLHKQVEGSYSERDELINNFNNDLRKMAESMKYYKDFESADLESTSILTKRQAYDGTDYNKLKYRGAEEFDFIVVGAGSAGAVIANRLSEIPHWRILLLEVGKGPNAITAIPLIAPSLIFTPYNWGYKSEKQPNFQLGLKDGRMNFQRGRGLGGTSLINYMMYTRGHPDDYDQWALRGNPGWSYSEIIPYYLKSEMANNLTIYDPQYHNTQGYLSVSESFRTPSAEAFLQAGNELGYPTLDYTGPELIGVSPIKSTSFRGRRHDTYTAFLAPIKHRSNLVIKTGSYVTKIIIDPETKVATGVRYVRNKRMYTAITSKEVILAAGALNSPKILQLSGVGPRVELQKFGIPVYSDLEGVGINMHDHICLLMPNIILNSSALQASDLLTPKAVSDYLFRGLGPYTSIGGVEGIGYMNTGVSPEIPPNVPDVEMIFASIGMNTDYGTATRLSFNIGDDLYIKYFKPLHGQHVVTIVPVLLKSRSTGSMRLKSKNPFSFPLFYGNYMTNDNDVKTMIAAIRIAISLGSTKSFKRYNARFHDPPIPGCEYQPADSDDYWECVIRTLGTSLYHQAGTCKMGSSEDSAAVVDHALRVYGVTGLRVADASVIPSPISSHTNAPSIMIGEKCGDLIKEYWLPGQRTK